MAGGEHAHHRARMRQRLRATHLEGFAPHEIVEFLLYYSIPVRDVNPIAHRLVDRFGTLNGVLRASREELMKVKGVGPRSADLIKAVDALTGAYRESVRSTGRRITSIREAMSLGPGPQDISCPTVNALFLGENERLICCTSWAWHAPFSSCREIIEQAVYCNARSVVLTLVYPEGEVAPSAEEWSKMRELLTVLAHCEVHTVDVLSSNHSGLKSWRAENILREKEESFGSLFPNWFDTAAEPF